MGLLYPSGNNGLQGAYPERPAYVLLVEPYGKDKKWLRRCYQSGEHGRCGEKKGGVTSVVDGGLILNTTG